MIDIALRPGRVDEAGTLSALALRAKAAWGYDAAFIEAGRRSLTVPFDALADRRVIVAEVGGAIAGFVSFGPPERPPELTGLWVEPAHTRQGIGRALWRAGVALARRRGWPDFVIAADPFAATRFYEPRGCERIGAAPSTARPGRMLPLYRYTLDPPPTAPQIDRARDAELRLLPALEMRAGARFRAVGRDDVADAPPMPLLSLELAHADGGVIVARAPSGLPVGFAVVEPLDDGLHLSELSVEPAWARQALGTRLLEHVVMLARQRGCPAVTLSTFADVPWNAPYYAARGFTPVPRAEQSAALRDIATADALRGLDPDARVVMRRPVITGGEAVAATDREAAPLAPPPRPPDGNLFADATPPPEGERFESLLRHGPVHIERIVSSATPEPGTYIQGQAEWVVLLRGRARLTVDGRPVALEPGDHLAIAPGVPHTVDETAEGTVWLAVHIDGATEPDPPESNE